MKTPATYFKEFINQKTYQTILPTILVTAVIVSITAIYAQSTQDADFARHKENHIQHLEKLGINTHKDNSLPTINIELDIKTDRDQIKELVDNKIAPPNLTQLEWAKLIVANAELNQFALANDKDRATTLIEVLPILYKTYSTPNPQIATKIQLNFVEENEQLTKYINMEKLRKENFLDTLKQAPPPYDSRTSDQASIDDTAIEKANEAALTETLERSHKEIYQH